MFLPLSKYTQNPGREALIGVLRFLFGLAALLFLPMWTLDYWQGWFLLGVFSASLLRITGYLILHDPALLRRRLQAGPRAEKDKTQKWIILAGVVSFIALIVIPAMDHRLQKPSMSLPLILLGDGLVALGFWIILRVFQANSYASAIVEADAGQTVISNGPYARVRHPMYSGGLVMLLGIPFALASWWDLLTVLCIIPIVSWRLVNEERFLRRHLTGYCDYCEKVRDRLVPKFW